MYKKFILRVSMCCFVCFTISGVRSKTIDFYAWMIWKTSKEYTIKYTPKDENKSINFESSALKVVIEEHCSEVRIDYKKYTYVRNNKSLFYGYTILNTYNDISLGFELDNKLLHYYIVHCSFLKNNNQFFTQKIMAIPELNKSDISCACHKGDSWECFEEYYVNETGTVIVSFLKKGIIAIITPKKISSKNFFTFNNAHDITFKYL